MELFTKIVKGFQLLTVFTKSPILVVPLGSGYAVRVEVNKITEGIHGSNFERYW